MQSGIREHPSVAKNQLQGRERLISYILPTTFLKFKLLCRPTPSSGSHPSFRDKTRYCQWKQQNSCHTAHYPFSPSSFSSLFYWIKSIYTLWAQHCYFQKNQESLHFLSGLFFLENTYLVMTLFINKICNRGPSTLGFSTEIPLEQHGTQDNGYSKYSPPVLSHSWVWTPTERGRFGQYKICPFKKFLSLKQKLSSWAKQVGVRWKENKTPPRYRNT